MEAPLDADRISRTALRIIAALAWIFAATTAALTLVDTVALAETSYRFLAVTATAAVFDLLSLGAIILFAAISLLGKEWTWASANRKTYLVPGCIIMSILSVGSTVASYVLVDINLAKVIDHLPAWWLSPSYIKYIVWGFATFSQGVMYISVSWGRWRMTGPTNMTLNAGPRDSVISSTRTRKPNPATSLQEMARPFARDARPVSASASRKSSQSFDSLRSSIQQVVRPVTSRSRLVSKPSTPVGSSSFTSEKSAGERPHQSDGFDTWDTSAVEQHYRDALMPSATSPNSISGPSRGTALEPIPGSRPASPAKPLDGPFPSPAGSSHEDVVMSPKPPPAIAQLESPTMSQMHIHPLFRRDSPTPPPAATPGTVITAAPYSSQPISRPLSRRPTKESLHEDRLRSNSGGVSVSPLGIS
ncbi:hypothetical protein EJ05DRAFT_142904 [Pseudovirgaria hyperparasitica]|uniref:Uncharacterized protein n=1 Tax=Pseudovirgaria hyperparasitica TaxID=470096 RepID=A0A6A6W091_9PEZI|nr:uncharacterized protein EJ05DRAFT_142904 [Pseudovirgaria hyperparasitica]KAF2754481.1 hypothetical protein EJ05DRAFT_142904 [Pseudovirgaria hyperparasitica]